MASRFNRTPERFKEIFEAFKKARREAMKGEFEDYLTACPLCGGDLRVVSLTASLSTPLHSDGFSVMDAKYFYTEDEVVTCEKCAELYLLDECSLYVEDEEEEVI